MTEKTDRYLRTGGPIPQIYPGTLAGITQALKDIASTSRFLPALPHHLWAIRAGQREHMKIFRGGKEQP